MPKVATRPEEAGSAVELIPEKPTLATLRGAVATWKACDLWMKGTRTVFGDGAGSAAPICR